MSKLRISVTLVVALLAGKAIGQPCGITPGIFVYGGTASVTYEADTTSIQPGWVTYGFEWKVNNSVFSTQPGFIDWLPWGYNHVQLNVFATNPSTGDSCTGTYSNIYYSTGDAVFPFMDVVANGLTVTFNGGFYGGSQPGSATASYDFGDGSPLSSSGNLNETYTYAAPGDYWVYLYVIVPNFPNGNASGQVGRKIHVDNGLANHESGVSGWATCNMFDVTATSVPPFLAGMVETNIPPQNYPTLYNGVQAQVTLNDVPGHDFVEIHTSDSNSGTDVATKLYFFEGCGIIPDTVTGTVYDDTNFNGIFEAGESGIPNVIIRVTGNFTNPLSASEQAEYFVLTDSAGNYSIPVPHAPVSVAMQTPGGYTLTFPAAANYNVNFNSGTSHPGYNWGLSALSTQLCGKTYLDVNQDSTYSAGTDNIFQNVHITVVNTITGVEYHTISGASGNYCIKLPPGNFIVTPGYWRLDSAAVYPDSIVVNSPGGGTFSNNNFGFYSSVTTNFELDLRSSMEARPGFDFTLNAHVTNKGFLPSMGTVVLSYDPTLTYVSHTPANGIVNTVNHTITWTSDSIRTGQLTGFSGTFNIPVSTPLGTVLTASATVTALPGFIENTLTDNSDSHSITVIGSYDPNDKHVSPQGIGPGGDLLHDTRLFYRIRFQNTGTASAINVIVTDTIDDDLDMGTLLMISASHNYVMVTNGRVVTWKFFNINLPDSNTNEPLSHGFIEYEISPRQGLADGTVIENSANIYFDYNPPVITNATVNTMQSVIVATGPVIPDAPFLVYPVPGRDYVMLQPRFESDETATIRLVDLAGKELKELYRGTLKADRNITCDLTGIAAGAYFIKAETSGQNKMLKIILQ